MNKRSDIAIKFMREIAAGNKKPPSGGSLVSGYDRGIHSGHPWPSPFGQPAAVPNGNPAVWSNPKGSHQVRTLHQIQKNRLAAVLLYLAEREGFEPSIRG